VSDFEDRLAALDPAAEQSYQHQNIESMITRVTKLPSTSKGRTWRTFQLKVAGGLVASALLTTGAIAAISAGPSLSVLAIQGTNKTPTPLSDKATYNSTMQVYEEFSFSAGSGLDETTPTSPSYQLQIPANGSSEASRVAGIFGVSGAPVNTNGDGSDWTVTDVAGDSLDYQNSGVPQWSFTSASSGAVSDSQAVSIAALPDHSTVDALAQSYASKLGYGYSLSTPTFGTSTSGTVNADGSIKTAVSTSDVSYSVLVEGFSTDQTLSFSVDSNDVVLAASGPAFTLGPPVNYPLESPQAGISALNTMQENRFPSNATTPTTTSGGSTTTTAPSGPPIVNVTLNSDSLSLEAYQLTDGSTWLLPIYNYAGVATNPQGTSSSSTWSELAIDPSYVKVSAASPGGITHGVVN
jgi:hypothetical protein